VRGCQEVLKHTKVLTKNIFYLLISLKKREKINSEEVAVKGAKMAGILGWSGSEGKSGPGNTHCPKRL
jgi:hypothetical protein